MDSYYSISRFNITCLVWCKGYMYPYGFWGVYVCTGFSDEKNTDFSKYY